MSARLDLTGHRFTRLVAIARVDYISTSQVSKWLCQCDCGCQTIVALGHLRSGVTRSCGCLNSEVSKAKATHRMVGTKVYRTWQNMLNRCRNPKVRGYDNYGARGITVCERWSTFENFLADMGQPPTLRHTIERIDNDGSYTPDNCCWATYKDQNNNRRNNKIITHDGRSLTIAQWSELTGLTQVRIWYRIFRSNMGIEAALTKPVIGTSSTFP